jgi:hypothetical protein
MTPKTPHHTYLFDRIFVALAMLGPIVMVIVAGMLPQGSRGIMIVTGHLLLAAILGSALVLRIVYELGFIHARRRLPEGRGASVPA